MLWLLLLFALSRPASDYPPKGVILLQDNGRVTLRWRVPGNSYRLQVWQDSQLVVNRPVPGPEGAVEVARGKPVRWRVTNPSGKSFESDFSVCAEPEYHADGRPGVPVAGHYQGLGGTSGGQIRARLSRDEAGMHLILWHAGRRNHYLFSQPGLLFNLTACGGAGAKGKNGRDGDRVNLYGEPGLDGTPGGNGGHIIISTGSAPWRDYLEVDVSAGPGGAGGLGGVDPFSEDSTSAPSGQKGADGFPGKVETVIQDGW